MFSKLLETDIETMETEDGLTLITHDTLRNIVCNNSRIEVSWEPIILRPDMCGFIATAKDSVTGRVEKEIGESNPQNLSNDIAKANPIIMAQIRAYDRAVIQLLDLPCGKVYSNQEVSSAKIKAKTASKKSEAASEPEKKVKEAYGCEIHPKNGKFAIFDKETNTFFTKKDNSLFLFDSEEKCIDALSKREEKRKKFNSEKELLITDDTIIKFGKYRNQRYGDVKNLSEFKEFLKQLREQNIVLGDPDQKKQYELLKDLAS